MKFLVITVIALLLAGCQSFVTPYSSNVTPEVTTAISDQCSSTSLKMGPLGEFSVITTWAKTQDGITTGSTTISGSKDTLNNVSTGLIGLLIGLLSPVK